MLADLRRGIVDLAWILGAALWLPAVDLGVRLDGQATLRLRIAGSKAPSGSAALRERRRRLLLEPARQHRAIEGIMVLPANVVFGWGYDHVGGPAAFAGGGAIALVAAIGLRCFVPSPREA